MSTAKWQNIAGSKKFFSPLGINYAVSRFYGQGTDFFRTTLKIDCTGTPESIVFHRIGIKKIVMK